MPGSKGLDGSHERRILCLENIETPVGLSYEGTPHPMMGTSASVMPLLSDVAEIPGESDVGWYDVETGEIEPATLLEGVDLRPSGNSFPPPEPDPAWLQRMILTYLDDPMVKNLAARLGVKYPEGIIGSAAVTTNGESTRRMLEEILRLLVL